MSAPIPPGLSWNEFSRAYSRYRQGSTREDISRAYHEYRDQDSGPTRRSPVRRRASPDRTRRGEYYDNIERATTSNEDYRRVVYTDRNTQLVYMSLRPGVEIGLETHPHTTQFIRVESGRGVAIVDGKRRVLSKDIAIMIPPGTEHNVVNTGSTRLNLYTLYSPPEHAPGLVQREHPTNP